VPRPQTDRERQLAQQIKALAAAGLGQVQDAEGAATLLDGVLAQARRDCGCAGATLYLVEEEALCLVQASKAGISPAALSSRRDHRVPLDASSPAGFAATSRTPFQTPDAYGLTGTPGFDPAGDQEGFRTRGLLALPIEDRDGGITGVLELVNPKSDESSVAFQMSVVKAAQALKPLAAEALEAERRERGHLESVFQLARVVEARDSEIDMHVRRISGYSAALAAAAGCKPDVVRWIRLASPLHDVGKVGISDTVLYKPGKLSDEEFAITREHSLLGRDLLADAGDSPLFAMAAQIAASHHERFDGKGYPAGLERHKIPLVGRIVAVADVFDALTTRRSYKPAMGIEQSLKIIRAERAKHFDPDLVDAFQAIFSEILDVKSRFSGE
jgi:putative two-component system response regulator